ncbi:HpcH/HpaI aldolase/citrate lyase family protein [Alteraurantiacibacter buctensis]|uniref:CoA ester lyase n=1 Tax=Alteraurantiacibacter buctensis TaxID=1503981 RepID=A0A844Z082_9SPHN|nr:CoA ester lyase [Alteraurantiacibacter buctensis]MXO73219.1 CoA ester lyase [Alteraurantiacibacter buctensis]
MTLRSWLFVPGDSERKLLKASSCGADAVVIDLEDAVAPEAKGTARMQAARWLAAHRQQVLSGQATARWVRINPLHSNLWREDLAVILSGQPDGIIVPKARGPEQLRMLSAELYELEQRNGITSNATRLIAMVGETAASALTIPAYATEELPRLAGLTWGAQDLAVAIGASRMRDGAKGAGGWTDTFRLVRSQALLAAHARAGVALETPYADFADLKGLKATAEAAKADGFTGMLAIHPDQVPVINQAFAPTEKEAAEARRIVELFAANPGAGALPLDGRMVEQPHLLQARRVLEALRG